MNHLKISQFPDFIQYFPDFLQRFPDFSLTKFFKVRKCERCGSLNPRLQVMKNVELFCKIDKQFNCRTSLDSLAIFEKNRLLTFPIPSSRSRNEGYQLSLF